MPVSYYFDQHIRRAICEQLRRRGVDILTTQEDGTETSTDETILERATSIGRVMHTYDARFKGLAEEWLRQGRTFAGLIFGQAQGVTIGQYVSDLELIAKATEPDEWINVIGHLPYQ
jgi:hypothetical protein